MPEADAAYAKAAGLSADELHKFLAAGWWVAGPLPADASLTYPFPADQAPDPSKPIAGAGGGPASVPWRAVPTGPQGQLNLTTTAGTKAHPSSP